VSVFERVEADGAAAVLEPAGPPRTLDAAQLVALVHEAAGVVGSEPARALELWDRAGALHDPETLDEALAQIGGGGLFGGGKRRKIVAGARHALRESSHVSTVCLAAAILGQLGDSFDIPSLETIAVHPALALHGATALAVHGRGPALAALLRLLDRSEGDQRVLVIDRLLPHTRQPAVRLALVRDALKGLSPQQAREVAADIAATCDVDAVLADEGAPEDLRAGAREVRRHAGPGSG
jgi:hypothetical protein